MSTMKLKDIVTDRHFNRDVYGQSESDRAAIHKANKIKRSDPAIMSFKWIGAKIKDAGIYRDDGWVFLGFIMAMCMLGLSIATLVMVCLMEPMAIIPGAILVALILPNISAIRDDMFLSKTVNIRTCNFDISGMLDEAYGKKDVNVEYNALINALDIYNKYADYGEKSRNKAYDNVHVAMDDLKRGLNGGENVKMTDDEALDMIRIESGEVIK